MNIQQAVKKILKSERLFAQKVDDKYIISNGYYLFAVSRPFYQAYFTTTSGLFKELNENGSFEIRDNTAVPCSLDFTRFIKSNDCNKPIHKSPFLTDWKTKDQMRLYITEDNKVAYFNNTYLEIIESLFGTDLNFKTTDGKEAISLMMDTERCIGILPVRNTCPYKVTFEWLNK